MSDQPPRSALDEMSVATMVATAGVLSALVEELLDAGAINAETFAARIEKLQLREQSGALANMEHYRGLLQTFITQALSHAQRTK